MGGASGYFSGLKRPDREHMNSDPCPYMRSASFMFLSGFIENKRLSAQVHRPSTPATELWPDGDGVRAGGDAREPRRDRVPPANVDQLVNDRVYCSSEGARGGDKPGERCEA